MRTRFGRLGPEVVRGRSYPRLLPSPVHPGALSRLPRAFRPSDHMDGIFSRSDRPELVREHADPLQAPDLDLVAVFLAAPAGMLNYARRQPSNDLDLHAAR